MVKSLHIYLLKHIIILMNSTKQDTKDTKYTKYFQCDCAAVRSCSEAFCIYDKYFCSLRCLDSYEKKEDKKNIFTQKQQYSLPSTGWSITENF